MIRQKKCGHYLFVTLIGTSTQLAVSTTLVNITKTARKNFEPYERKCWMQDEIQLEQFSYESDYR